MVAYFELQRYVHYSHPVLLMSPSSRRYQVLVINPADVCIIASIIVDNEFIPLAIYYICYMLSTTQYKFLRCLTFINEP